MGGSIASSGVAEAHPPPEGGEAYTAGCDIDHSKLIFDEEPTDFGVDIEHFTGRPGSRADGTLPEAFIIEHIRQAMPPVSPPPVAPPPNQEQGAAGTRAGLLKARGEGK